MNKLTDLTIELKKLEDISFKLKTLSNNFNLAQIVELQLFLQKLKVDFNILVNKIKDLILSLMNTSLKLEILKFLFLTFKQILELNTEVHPKLKVEYLS